MNSLTIPGIPIAKKRPRFARRGKFVVTYSDQETEEGRFLWELRQQWNREPIKCPISISMVFYMPRPKNHFGTGKNKLSLKKTAPAYHISKPDIDNLEKMVYDCLNRFVWDDDSLVFESKSKKVYSDHPRTEITITEGIDYGQGAETC